MKKENLLRVGFAAGAVTLAAGIAIGTKVSKKKKMNKLGLNGIYENWLERTENGRPAVLDCEEKFSMNDVPAVIDDIAELLYRAEDCIPDKSFILHLPDGGSMAINAHVCSNANDCCDLFLPDKMRNLRRHDLADYEMSHTEMSYDSDYTGAIGLYAKSTIQKSNGTYVVIHILSENATRNVDYILMFTEQIMYAYRNAIAADESGDDKAIVKTAKKLAAKMLNNLYYIRSESGEFYAVDVSSDDVKTMQGIVGVTEENDSNCGNLSGEETIDRVMNREG